MRESVFPVIADIMNLFEYYKKNVSETDFPQVANLLIEQIFWTLKCAPNNTKVDETNLLDKKHILAPIIQYINDNLTALDGVEDLCKNLHVSRIK